MSWDHRRPVLERLGNTVLLFDNSCGFCRRNVDFLVRHGATGRTPVLAWQALDPGQLPVAPDRLGRDVVFVRGGEIHRGTRALAGAMGGGRRSWRTVASVIRAPLARNLAAYAYAKITANRHSPAPRGGSRIPPMAGETRPPRDRQPVG